MTVQFDKDGFLREPDAWTPAVAEEIAAREELALTDAHWEVIHLLREFHARFGIAPANRALVNFAAQKLGPEKGRSVYLMSLFPGSPAKLGSKIAGLPKPDHCL